MPHFRANLDLLNRQQGAADVARDFPFPVSLPGLAFLLPLLLSLALLRLLAQ